MLLPLETLPPIEEAPDEDTMTEDEFESWLRTKERANRLRLLIRVVLPVAFVFYAFNLPTGTYVPSWLENSTQTTVMRRRNNHTSLSSVDMKEESTTTSVTGWTARMKAKSSGVILEAKAERMIQEEKDEAKEYEGKEIDQLLQFWSFGDRHRCAKELGISFVQLFLDMLGETYFCHKPEQNVEANLTVCPRLPFVTTPSKCATYTSLLEHTLNRTTNSTNHTDVREDKEDYSKLEECVCTSPFEPQAAFNTNTIAAGAYRRNQQWAHGVNTTAFLHPDVVFLGDSITEHFSGQMFARTWPRLKGISDSFYANFTKEGGSYFTALPMGVAADRPNNLLYRLRNGEMPDSLVPKVWWILIGTNDLQSQCRKETTLGGILRVAKEVWDRERRLTRNSTIVINSLLPRGHTPLVNNSEWHQLDWINERLRCMADAVPELVFSNSTDQFVTENPLRVAQETMNDYLHPSEQGFLGWSGQILDMIDLLLKGGTEVVLARNTIDGNLELGRKEMEPRSEPNASTTTESRAASNTSALVSGDPKVKTVNIWSLGDQHGCAKDLNFSFTRLYTNMLEETYFCVLSPGYVRHQTAGSSSLADCPRLPFPTTASLCDDDKNKANSTVLKQTGGKLGRCKCPSPFEAVPHPQSMNSDAGDYHSVADAYRRNQLWAQGINTTMFSDPDVVFLGDSIVEQFSGQIYGQKSNRLGGVLDYFRTHYTRQGGANFTALPLGVAEEIPNGLLHRLRNGELPITLTPKVWWILIGTNSIGHNCTKETTLAAILRVVEEVWDRELRVDSNATIVINSLLPRGPLPLVNNTGWQYLKWINDRLACIARSVPRLSFYNATEHFVRKDLHQVNRKKMKDWLHPSLEGIQDWSQHMVPTIESLLGQNVANVR